MAYVTQDDLRKLLRKRRAEFDTQKEMAAATGAKPQNLSLMLKGAPINGRVLRWLGYEAVNDLYRPLKGK